MNWPSSASAKYTVPQAKGRCCDGHDGQYVDQPERHNTAREELAGSGGRPRSARGSGTREAVSLCRVYCPNTVGVSLETAEDSLNPDE